MPDLETKVSETMEKSARLSFWVVTAKNLKGPESLLPHLEGHFDFIFALEKAGKVFAAGPFLGDDGDNSGSGMIILRASSRKEVMDMLTNDPFYSHNLRQYDVCRWQVNVGGMTVKIQYSNGMAQLI